MAAIFFASRLREDGSLTMPREAVEELGLHPGDEVKVRVEANASVLQNDQAVVLDLHTRIRALEAEDKEPVSERSLKSALTWMQSMYEDATSDAIWIDPLINYSSDGEVVFEWWKDNRKVTVYVTGEEIEAKKRYLDRPVASRVYVPVETELQRKELWQWLIDSGTE